jgi:hypothetical protein
MTTDNPDDRAGPAGAPGRLPDPAKEGPSSNPSPPARTSGFAIAALVLSLIWLGGLGSMLAVVFGSKAKQDIRRSSGDLGGDGMATAGIVLGILGIMGAATVWIGLLAGVHAFQKSVKQLTTPQTLAMGQTGRLSGIDSIAGISTVTVYSYTQPVSSQDPAYTPGPGKQFATAYVRVCAGSSGSSNGPNLLDFSVVFPGGQQVGASPGDVRKPSLADAHALAAHQCALGYVPFQIAKGTTPTSVQYQALAPYRWAIEPPR